MSPEQPAPTDSPPGARHFRVGWPACLATAVSLGGYALCGYYESTEPYLVGLGLALAFAGFLGTSLALVLDSDRGGD